MKKKETKNKKLKPGEKFVGIKMDVPKAVNDRIKMMSAPRIALPGWWWKKHFKSHQKLRVYLQNMSDFIWKNGGYEEHERMMRKIASAIYDTLSHFVFGKGFYTKSSYGKNKASLPVLYVTFSKEDWATKSFFQRFSTRAFTVLFPGLLKIHINDR